jgi:hypothetical protein
VTNKNELPRALDATWAEFVAENRADLEAQAVIDVAVNAALSRAS